MLTEKELSVIKRGCERVLKILHLEQEAPNYRLEYRTNAECGLKLLAEIEKLREVITKGVQCCGCPILEEEIESWKIESEAADE